MVIMLRGAAELKCWTSIKTPGKGEVNRKHFLHSIVSLKIYFYIFGKKRSADPLWSAFGGG